jgi:ABC-type glycerol-3-phosphate transport system permease component
MAEVNTDRLKASTRQAGREAGGTAAIFIFLLILGVFMALPVYLTVIMSIKPVEELFVFPPRLYAIRPTLDNFRDMFRVLGSSRVPFSRYVFNSIAVTVTVTVLLPALYLEVPAAETLINTEKGGEA